MTDQGPPQGALRMPDSALAFFAQFSEPDGDILDIADDALYQAAQAFDSSLTIRSRLLLRLIDPAGEQVSGWASKDVQEKIAAPVCKQVAAALSKGDDLTRSEAELGLVGVRSGSVVLEFAPRVASHPAGDGELLGTSRADDAVRLVMKISSLFEDVAPLDRVKGQFGKNTRLLRATRQVMEGLDECGMNMGVRWFDSRGQESRQTVSERGRSHARTLFRRIEKEDEATVHGMIVGVDLTGTVTMVDSLPAAKNRRVIHMEPDQVDAYKTRIGDYAHFRVREARGVDKVGLGGKARWLFLSEVSHQEPFASLDADAPVT